MKQKAVIQKQVWDITSLVKLTGPPVLIADRRKKNRASTFRVQVSSDAFDGEITCFLKTFPANMMNTVNLTTESTINQVLCSHVSKKVFVPYHDFKGDSPSVQEFGELLKLSSLKRAVPWPLCYGHLTVPDPFSNPSATTSRRRLPKSAPEPPRLQALLFEFLDDLKPLTLDHIDDDGLMETKVLSAFAQVHGAGVQHRDWQNRDLWPNIGFHNLFVKDGEIVILDFDHSRIAVDNTILEDEEGEMRDFLKKALDNKGRDLKSELSKEVLKLLA